MTGLALELAAHTHRRRPRRALLSLFVLASVLGIGALATETASTLEPRTQATLRKIAREYVALREYGNGPMTVRVYADVLRDCPLVSSPACLEDQVGPATYYLVLSGHFTCYSCTAPNQRALERPFHRITIVVKRDAHGRFSVLEDGPEPDPLYLRRMGGGVVLP